MAPRSSPSPGAAPGWLRASASLELPLGLRLRAYAWVLGLTLASVPFLHLYIAVELGPGELALHALDIAGGVLLAIVLLEGLGGIVQRRRNWRFDGPRGVLMGLGAVGVALAYALPGALHDLLPQTGSIRHKHISSGYGDMSLRVLPLAALIFWLAFQAVRRDLLARELASLRRLNSALGARAHRASPAPSSTDGPGPLVLRHEGGELWVHPDEVICVSAQENYCAFVLAPAADASAARRPLVRMTLAEALASLPAERFVQTHRSHIANLARVREIRRDRQGRRCDLVLDGGASVPVSRARLSAVREQVTASLVPAPRAPDAPQI